MIQFLGEQSRSLDSSGGLLSGFVWGFGVGGVSLFGFVCLFVCF